MASILLHRGRSLNEMDLGLLVEVAELGVTVGMLVEDDAVGDALAVAAERVMDLAGGSSAVNGPRGVPGCRVGSQAPDLHVITWCQSL